MTALQADRLQMAVFKRLQQDETLSALLSGIHDEVPEGVALPYLTMGETTAEDSALKDLRGSSITFSLFIVSEEPGQMQVKELMAAVDSCLNRWQPELANADAGEMVLTSAGVVRQFSENGSRYRGRMSYRVKIFEMAET